MRLSRCAAPHGTGDHPRLAAVREFDPLHAELARLQPHAELALKTIFFCSKNSKSISAPTQVN